MTVKEMHIEIGQSTQKISANATRKLRPAEIDWLLNKNYERYIQSKVRPKKDGSGGFEIDQLGVDAIRPLLRTKTLSAQYTKDTGETLYECILPGDYAYLISDDSAVKQVCCDTVALSTGNRQLCVLPFGISPKSASPYYVDVTITTLDPVPVVISITDISTRYQGSYTGQVTMNDRFMIRDILIEEMRRKGLNAYWERYGDFYAPRSIIIAGSPGATIAVDGTATNGTLVSRPFQYWNYSEALWKPNRLSPADSITTLQLDGYKKSNYLSPISELEQGSLFVYGDDLSFIVTKVRVSYIKKAARIDLTLGQDCELPSEFHNAVCDLTVEYFKGMIADPNWEVKLKDNMQRSVTT
jgi:hypothetical protein